MTKRALLEAKFLEALRNSTNGYLTPKVAARYMKITPQHAGIIADGLERTGVISRKRDSNGEQQWRQNPLVSPDYRQCQATILEGSFMTFGPRNEVRCKNRPTWIAVENEITHEDGYRGSMSMCDSCKSVYMTRHREEAATFYPIPEENHVRDITVERRIMPSGVFYDIAVSGRLVKTIEYNPKDEADLLRKVALALEIKE